jgi:uncharacterized protein YdeI (YjbR/CyaY-like superfamily)
MDTQNKDNTEMPKELSNELNRDSVARFAFNKLSKSHRQEYIDWVKEAKKRETRVTRAKKTIQLLLGTK